MECWGSDEWGQTEPPAGTFVEVGSGSHYSCGLRADGEVECWGCWEKGERYCNWGTPAPEHGSR